MNLTGPFAGLQDAPGDSFVEPATFGGDGNAPDVFPKGQERRAIQQHKLWFLNGLLFGWSSNFQAPQANC